jgi:predicted kinase
LANVIQWHQQIMPFDGIEFNEAFRWIDVLSDAAFVAMDFFAFGRADFCRIFVNTYLEHTGDYLSLSVLQWYLVYRALVRAKVAAIRARQFKPSTPEHTEATQDCSDHVDLAHKFTSQLISHRPRFLWITHGVSGSGKTYATDRLIPRVGAIRVRSDVERKRLFSPSKAGAIDEVDAAKLYGDAANRRTYDHLHHCAARLLQAGFPVIVDATFLRKSDRDRFQRLADDESVEFGIVDCHAETATLQERIRNRRENQNDASDADSTVLRRQLETQETLTERERRFIVRLSHPD